MTVRGIDPVSKEWHFGEMGRRIEWPSCSDEAMRVFT